MPHWREPHWAEGMLLLPQHLQAAHRFWDTMLGAAWDTSNPFSWGFDELVLSDAQIRNGIVGVERCRARTPQGTWVCVPENTHIAPRPLGDALTRSPDGLTVYLAIPKLHEIRPNAAYEAPADGRPMRFCVEPLELRDENTGDNAQQIDIHVLSARLLFGDESRAPGFELLPVVRVLLSGEEGGIPRRDETFVPPLLRVGAWPELQRMVAAVVHEASARNRELAAEAKSHEMSFRSGIEEHTERLLMIHVLNQSLGYLRQMVAVAETRPFTAYVELCRLAGQLSVFNPDRDVNPDRSVKDYALYDHAELGKNFSLLCKHIHELLRAFSIGLVKWRDFEARPRGEGLQVALEDDWLTGRRDMYVGVHCSTMDDTELDGVLKGMNWKIAALEEVDMLFQAGLLALELRPVRGATGILPASPDIKYYRIMHDPERWPKVEAGKVLAIRYAPDVHTKLEGIRFRIYVVLRNP